MSFFFSTDEDDKWEIKIIFLLSGIISGIFLSFIALCCYRCCFRKQKLETNPKTPDAEPEGTYQELDLFRMNEENNYQSLTVNSASNNGYNHDESNSIKSN